jgi:hypothetical protein
MANDITGNPIKIDTQGTGLPEQLRVRKLRWVGATTAGHRITVADQYGNLFWESISPGDNYLEESDFTMLKGNRAVLSGILVDTLDSGILYIYQ